MPPADVWDHAHSADVLLEGVNENGLRSVWPSAACLLSCGQAQRPDITQTDTALSNTHFTVKVMKQFMLLSYLKWEVFLGFSISSFLVMMVDKTQSRTNRLIGAFVSQESCRCVTTLDHDQKHVSTYFWPGSVFLIWSRPLSSNDMFYHTV